MVALLLHARQLFACSIAYDQASTSKTGRSLDESKRTISICANFQLASNGTGQCCLLYPHMNLLAWLIGGVVDRWRDLASYGSRVAWLCATWFGVAWRGMRFRCPGRLFPILTKFQNDDNLEFACAICSRCLLGVAVDHSICNHQ